ncbi:MAG: 2Fe-2S iron-sulfur cluster-binding protein [Cyclobacteriaceae bacterium]
MTDVKFVVENLAGEQKELELPTDMGLNLMEALKASGYDIQATCGGMALCATCHVGIQNHEELVGEPNDDEMDMLDTIPDGDFDSRLACQIRVTEKLSGLLIRLRTV